MTVFYPNGLDNQPVAKVTLEIGNQNGWVSDNGGGGVSVDIPNDTYARVRVTAIRFNHDVALPAHLVGFVDVAGAGQVIVAEGNTMVIEGPVDSSTLTFTTQPGLILQIAADV